MRISSVSSTRTTISPQRRGSISCH